MRHIVFAIAGLCSLNSAAVADEKIDIRHDRAFGKTLCMTASTLISGWQKDVSGNTVLHARDDSIPSDLLECIRSTLAGKGEKTEIEGSDEHAMHVNFGEATDEGNLRIVNVSMSRCPEGGGHVPNSTGKLEFQKTSNQWRFAEYRRTKFHNLCCGDNCS